MSDIIKNGTKINRIGLTFDLEPPLKTKMSSFVNAFIQERILKSVPKIVVDSHTLLVNRARPWRIHRLGKFYLLNKKFEKRIWKLLKLFIQITWTRIIRFR